MAEDHHTVAGNVGPEGLTALEQASDLALAHLDDLYPIAGDPSRVLTPCLEARSPSLVLLRHSGRSHNNDVDVAGRSGVAACEGTKEDHADGRGSQRAGGSADLFQNGAAGTGQRQ